MMCKRIVQQGSNQFECIKVATVVTNVGRHHEGNELSVTGSSLQLHGGFIASEFNFLSFFSQSSILFCASSCASV